MKTNTIKWRIFKYNLLVIILLITLVTVIFNVAVGLYIEKDTLVQLNKIAAHTEDAALRQGPGFFLPPGRTPPPPPDDDDANEIVRFYFMLDRSIREPLSVLNADYILLGSNKSRITPFPEEFYTTSSEVLNQITAEVNKLDDLKSETYLSFHLSGIKYIAVIKPVSQKNSFGLGWVIIYSSLQKVNQLQTSINIILFAILIFSALIIVLFSSQVSKKISAPFSSLNQHIRDIAERNFNAKLHIPVDDELQELVNNINIMSEKLETYDNAQKTFLQNASHEFRTPLMSIQSYAEGIKYDVVDHNTAADIIIDESKRMTHLVEDLLYLSRLNTIEENYHFTRLNLNELLHTCVERLEGIAAKSNITLTIDSLVPGVVVHGDEEKLSRAIVNVISNCIRYASGTVVIASTVIEKGKLVLTISDDGPGFEAKELPILFDRFYKGKNGNFGLGLAITKNIIEKHNGQITAANKEAGALFTLELPLI